MKNEGHRQRCCRHLIGSGGVRVTVGRQMDPTELGSGLMLTLIILLIALVQLATMIRSPHASIAIFYILFVTISIKRRNYTLNAYSTLPLPTHLHLSQYHLPHYLAHLYFLPFKLKGRNSVSVILKSKIIYKNIK